MIRTSISPVFFLSILSTAMAFVCTSGCSSGLRAIDHKTDKLMVQASEDMGGDAIAPTIQRLHDTPSPLDVSRDPTAERIPTRNPSADDLDFTAREEAHEIATRLQVDPDRYNDALQLDLNGALAFAMRHSREYRFFEEEYILAALRLLIERHLWGPRFFNDVSGIVGAAGDDGFFDTSLRLVNEFTVTQRLPYGGQVAATALARAAEDLHSRASLGGTQSAEVIVSAQIPLLRGAGTVAREDRIQAERNLIYAAREFEQFRREFLFDISTDFLDLVVRSQAIENSRRQVESLQWLEERSRAFVETGRETPIDRALAEQATLFARDTLNQQLESYRLAVDRFKVRLGLASEAELVIVRSDPGLPVPDISLEEAVARAMAYRLDLQTRRDQLDDARRRVTNAANALLPDLNISGFAAMGTDPRQRRAGLSFRPQDSEFEVAVTLGLPLDREIERLNVRQAQINLERSAREYDRFRDTLAVDTRSAVRDIERSLFSLRIQEENVRIAERGQQAIDADPDRATARDRTEAVDRLLRARDQRDSAYRDLQVAILRYLLNSGQLRVAPDGTIEPLRNMQLAGEKEFPAGGG